MIEVSTTGRGPAGRDPLAAYLLGFLTVGLAVSFLGPGLLHLQARAGVSVSAISVLFSSQALGYLVGSLLAAPGVDSNLGNRLLAISFFGLAGAIAVVPAVSPLWVLGIAFLSIGAGAGAIDLASNTMLVWSRGDGVGPSMNGLHFAFGVGAVSAPILVQASLSTTGGLGVACWVTAAVSVASGAWVLRSDSPRMPVHTDRSSGTGTAAGRRTTTTRLAVIAGFFMLYVGLEMGAGGWLYAYARARHLGQGGFAALLTTMFWGTFTLGRLVAIGLSRRLRPAQLLVGSAAVCVAASSGLIVAGDRPGAALVAVALLGTALAPQYPSMMTLAGLHLNLTGRATAWFIGGSALGGLALPWLIGQLFGAVGAATMPVAVFVTALVTLVWIVLVARMLTTSTTIEPGEEPAAVSAIL